MLCNPCFLLCTGTRDCKHFTTKGWCFFGQECLFNHPIHLYSENSLLTNDKQNLEEEEEESAAAAAAGEDGDEKEAVPDCKHFTGKGWCAFGNDCKFKHRLKNNYVSNEDKNINSFYTYDVPYDGTLVHLNLFNLNFNLEMKGMAQNGIEGNGNSNADLKKVNGKLLDHQLHHQQQSNHESSNQQIPEASSSLPTTTNTTTTNTTNTTNTTTTTTISSSTNANTSTNTNTSSNALDSNDVDPLLMTGSLHHLIDDLRMDGVKTEVPGVNVTPGQYERNPAASLQLIQACSRSF